tara:strand:+ start:790 stop:1290 length:501 start_codon:yes stop_codon:yes gene_type:complete
MASTLINVENNTAKTIAASIKKEILNSQKVIKNKTYRLIMIDFFLLDYCKDNTDSYLFYTDIEHSSLMCIAKNPRQEANILSDYAFIECVVKGPDSNVTFSDFLDKAITIKAGKVALGSTPILYDFYKRHGFVFVSKYMEDWSRIGEFELKESYAMKLNNSHNINC